jgi:hypothetical protein
MKRRMYADELMKKLVSTDDMKLLDIITDDDLSTEEKIKSLVKGDASCSNSK